MHLASAMLLYNYKVWSLDLQSFRAQPYGAPQGLSAQSKNILKNLGMLASIDGVTVKGNIVRTNVYHKYIKDLKLNIIIDLDGFIY